MLKQFLNSVIAKYRNLLVSCRSLTDIWQRKLFLKKKNSKASISSKDLSGMEKKATCRVYQPRDKKKNTRRSKVVTSKVALFKKNTKFRKNNS